MILTYFIYQLQKNNNNKKENTFKKFLRIIDILFVFTIVHYYIIGANATIFINMLEDLAKRIRYMYICKYIVNERLIVAFLVLQ